MQNLPEPTTNPGDARDLRQLLEAVLEAVTLPHDGTDHARRMEERADWVRATIKGALEEDPANIGWNADFLRGRLAVEETEAAERAKPVDQAQTGNRCARCRKPFDPADLRHDGHGRYASTPHCRRCIDNCHDGGAEHVCIICDPKRYGGAR